MNNVWIKENEIMKNTWHVHHYLHVQPRMQIWHGFDESFAIVRCYFVDPPLLDSNSSLRFASMRWHFNFTHHFSIGLKLCDFPGQELRLRKLIHHVGMKSASFAWTGNLLLYDLEIIYRQAICSSILRHLNLSIVLY